MNNYYTVFDLTPADGSVSIGVAKKNPSFNPDPDDSGSIPELIKKHGGVIAAVIILLVLGFIAGGIIYKKRKTRQT